MTVIRNETPEAVCVIAEVATAASSWVATPQLQTKLAHPSLRARIRPGEKPWWNIGDTCYLYTSTDGIGACEGWTQVWISKDMVNWVNYKMNWNPKDKNWAPDCMEKDGKYYLFHNYPCMTFAAEGDSPVGPWKPYAKAPLIPDKFVPPVITLDFQSFEDDDGAIYGYFTTWAGNNDAGSGWVKFNDDMKTFAGKGRIPYGRCINLGRNEPDAWSTFNGEIGDVFLYKSALSDAERKNLGNYVAAKLVGGSESGAAK